MMQRTLALVLASAVTLAACGSDGDSDAVVGSADEPRTIEVTMTDIAFTPTELDVASGETVTFVFRNDGAVRHEAVFGTSAEQEAHHAEMAEMGGAHDGMEEETMSHDGEMTELHAAVVAPGESVELTHTFEAAGPTMVGCHEPGHWEAGMKIDIDVT
jgi:uncharacterized cupredoxin-like copper-binding protein